MTRTLSGSAALALAAGVLLLLLAPARSARAQDNEPPPWESGDVGGAPPWETGAPPPAQKEKAPPPKKKGPQVYIAPAGVDTESPYQERIRTMKPTPPKELGIEKRKIDDVDWTVLPFRAWGPVAYGSFGYEAGSRSGHLVLSMAGGWSVWGHWKSLRSAGRPPELEGTGTNVLLGLDLAPSVANGVAPSWTTIGVRVQQVAAFGRHLIMGELALGGRKDLGTSVGGFDLSFGVAYAYAISPPYTIPIEIELVRHYSGAFDNRRWAARISIAWPFWFHF